MLYLHKNDVLDEDRRTVAVQLPIVEFEQMAALLKNHGLAKFVDGAGNDESASGEAAQRTGSFPKTDSTRPKSDFREALRRFRALADLSGLGDVDEIFSNIRDKSPGRRIAL
uniref:Uncharacterized protein n=1 Tax=Candidatus Kentrum sp. DK TaxID=2126562 RepID=A0A450RYT4_9GAMM|nr:MAG: hypothetical protein BECKDK2373C_GA0170839_100819 [Candidatus Kentron sp. DK]